MRRSLSSMLSSGCSWVPRPRAAWLLGSLCATALGACGAPGLGDEAAPAAPAAAAPAAVAPASPDVHTAPAAPPVPAAATESAAGLRGRDPLAEHTLACRNVRADAALSKRPVDIIFVIDNSGSMTDEIVAVQNNLNTNFADIIGTSGLDYRVVMVTSHGDARARQSICVSKPLSSVDCSPVPLLPGNNPPRFYHYSIEIESTDSLRRLLNSYNGVEKDQFGLAPLGWSQWLRSDAFKVFIEITDDESALDEVAFETELFAKTPRHFGDATNRNYVFHTIGGLRENSPATKPWEATDPLQLSKCTRGGGAVNASTKYQRLSIRTGGLRFPICEYGSFDSIFRAIASGVIAGSKIDCSFPLPTPPAGDTIDPSSVGLEYTPMGTGALVTFRQVANAAACAPASFYLERDRVVLCPDACSVVQRDARAKLQVVYSCVGAHQPNGSACSAATECTSGFCVDGVCCDGACGGGSDGDCQACAARKGAATDGTCGAVTAGTVCRGLAGGCDTAEVCDGTATACPSDRLQPEGAVCRGAEGICDTAEVCSGTSAQCPPDGVQRAGTVCRAAAGPCDAAELCSGTSAQCPPDALAAGGTICRAAAGACDAAELCSGTSAQCPPDALALSGTVCRAAAGPCDSQEVCSGTSAACPADKLKSSSTTCRAAAGPCDTAEKCSGSSAQCPTDKLKSNTTVCRASAGACDLAEFCSGTSAACPTDQFKPVIAVCRPAAGACDLVDYCTGASPACPPDDLVPAGTVCRAAVGSCDQDEVCSGTTAACPVDQSMPDGTACAGGMCKAGMCI
ncbi:MAG: hypothetical protein U1A78_34670 [Polyangia bacterium]